MSALLINETFLTTFLRTQKSGFALKSAFLSGFTLLRAFLSAQKALKVQQNLYEDTLIHQCLLLILNTAMKVSETRGQDGPTKC